MVASAAAAGRSPYRVLRDGGRDGGSGEAAAAAEAAVEAAAAAVSEIAGEAAQTEAGEAPRLRQQLAEATALRHREVAECARDAATQAGAG